MSCPDGGPRKKRGEITAVAVRATKRNATSVETCAFDPERPGPREVEEGSVVKTPEMVQPPKQNREYERPGAKAGSSPKSAHARIADATAATPS
jgi:hypothetical protein